MNETEIKSKPEKYNPKTWAEMKTTHKIATVSVSIFVLFALSTCFMPETLKTPEEAKAAVDAYAKSTTEAMLPCGQATEEYGTAMTKLSKGRTNSVAVFAIATEAKAKCKQAQLDLSAVSPPTSLDPSVSEVLSKAETECFASVMYAEQMIDQGMIALDGDLRPSVINEGVAKSKQAVDATRLCGLSIAMAQTQVTPKAAVTSTKP